MVRKKYNKKEIAIGISCIITVILILSFYIWHQTESINLGYRTGELEEEVLNLKKEVEKLETIKSSLLSLDKVEKIAKDELKMAPTKDEQIIYENFNNNP